MAATLNEVRLLSNKRKSELEDITNKHQKKVKLVLKKRESNQNLLENNGDYIALTSANRLNKLESKKIELDLIILKNLYQKFTTCHDKQELIDFFIKLNNNELKLPTSLKIIKCPPVKNLQFITNHVDNQESIYTSLKLFKELGKN